MEKTLLWVAAARHQKLFVIKNILPHSVCTAPCYGRYAKSGGKIVLNRRINRMAR
ncbi:hypothetical protein [Chromobacterium haemolyticum]|uniref:hypothetical protein n=1 Tax=Chromobacterium haemolyticum TaxID=394935 RepID=UPI0015946CE6|nr:hypothetical protein [Chromobacterium haemolyticum]